jgi:hypothetical protein
LIPDWWNLHQQFTDCRIHNKRCPARYSIANASRRNQPPWSGWVSPHRGFVARYGWNGKVWSYLSVNK